MVFTTCRARNAGALMCFSCTRDSSSSSPHTCISQGVTKRSKMGITSLDLTASIPRTLSAYKETTDGKLSGEEQGLHKRNHHVWESTERQSRSDRT